MDVPRFRGLPSMYRTSFVLTWRRRPSTYSSCTTPARSLRLLSSRPANASIRSSPAKGMPPRDSSRDARRTSSFWPTWWSRSISERRMSVVRFCRPIASASLFFVRRGRGIG